MLDTSILVAMREGDVPVIRKSAKLEQPALISVLSAVELEGGVPQAAEGLALRRAKLDQIYDAVELLPFSWEEAQAYRLIIQARGFSRSAIIDRMIAAQALVAGARLATLNPRDFGDIPSLAIEDWRG